MVKKTRITVEFNDFGQALIAQKIKCLLTFRSICIFSHRCKSKTSKVTYNRVIVFCQIWFLSKKKYAKPVFFLKPTGFGSVILEKNPGSNRFSSVFPVWLGLSLGSGLVRFFRFHAYKTKPVDFFKILIGFFLLFSFFNYFFQFSQFNQFLICFSHRYLRTTTPIFFTNLLFSANFP